MTTKPQVRKVRVVITDDATEQPLMFAIGELNGFTMQTSGDYLSLIDKFEIILNKANVRKADDLDEYIVKLIGLNITEKK